MARILVVEDNEDLLAILEQLLRRDHEVVVARSGEEAIDAAARERPDMVLLDLQLPSMDGIETGLALKQALGGDVAVLVLTARADQAHREAVLASGCCDAYLSKPAPFPTIVAEVEALLDSRRSVT